MKELEHKSLVTENQLRRKTRRSFIWFGLSIFAAILIWQWLIHQPLENDMLRPFRRVLAFNEKLFGSIISNKHTAPAFTKNQVVKKPKVNGIYGLKTPLNLKTWRLKVVNNSSQGNGKNDTLFLTIDDLKALPKTEIIFDFKCIEGWSQVTHWGGVKFSDFLAKYKLGMHNGKAFNLKDKDNLAKYVGLVTPDGQYYVGIDMASALHPQTLLCYEMNGKPLKAEHGAPLRLIIPVKYGIKSLKRIGLIQFADKPPRDYWSERGYDYFAGL